VNLDHLGNLGNLDHLGNLGNLEQASQVVVKL
jgi:hypothetical protein